MPKQMALAVGFQIQNLSKYSYSLFVSAGDAHYLGRLCGNPRDSCWPLTDPGRERRTVLYSAVTGDF